jgi:hypothetical protein
MFPQFQIRRYKLYAVFPTWKGMFNILHNIRRMYAVSPTWKGMFNILHNIRRMTAMERVYIRG